MKRYRADRAFGRDGFALLIVLWMLVPLSVLFITLTGTARSDGRLTFNLRDAARLSAAADGALETAIFGLLQPGASLAPQRIVLDGASVTVTTETLSGLVNPNIAAPDLLRAVMIQRGIEPALAERIAIGIAEWRNAAPRTGPNPADAPYRAAGLDYGPAAAPFETIGELRLVLGMTQATAATIAPMLTLDTDRPPEPTLAPAPIRAALAELGIKPAGLATLGTAFALTAEATGGSGARVVRQARIRLTPGERRPWRVLAWGTAPGT